MYEFNDLDILFQHYQINVELVYLKYWSSFEEVEFIIFIILNIFAQHLLTRLKIQETRKKNIKNFYRAHVMNEHGENLQLRLHHLYLFI